MYYVKVNVINVSGSEKTALYCTFVHLRLLASIDSLSTQHHDDAFRIAIACSVYEICRV